MVQILPPKYNVGDQIGQSLQRGLEQGGNLGFQRGMLQNALKGLDNIPSDASPLEKTKYMLQATAGLPDQGRILQALSPMLIGEARTSNIFGEPQGLQGN